MTAATKSPPPSVSGQYDDAYTNDDEAFIAMMQEKVAFAESKEVTKENNDSIIVEVAISDESPRSQNSATIEEELFDDYDEEYDDDVFLGNESCIGGVGNGVNMKSMSFQSSKLNLDSKSNKAMSHSVSNAVTKMHNMETSKRTSHTGRDDRATSEQCLDPRTRMILFKLLSTGVFEAIDGCLSTGKEANVYYAKAGGTKVSNAFLKEEEKMLSQSQDEVLEYAVKIYKTSILVFKDRDKYVSGEYRWRKGYCKLTKFILLC